MATISNFVGYPNPWSRSGPYPLTFRWDCDVDIELQLRWYNIYTGHLEYAVGFPAGGYPCGMQGKNYFYHFNTGLGTGVYKVRLYESDTSKAEFIVVVGA